MGEDNYKYVRVLFCGMQPSCRELPSEINKVMFGKFEYILKILLIII